MVPVPNVSALPVPPIQTNSIYSLVTVLETILVDSSFSSTLCIATNTIVSALTRALESRPLVTLQATLLQCLHLKRLP